MVACIDFLFVCLFFFLSLKRLPSHVSAKDKSAIFRALPVYRILDPEVNLI